MILLIYNEFIADSISNSILKILINLKLYRNDIIELKFNYGVDLESLRQNILDIIAAENIKLVFCVWAYLEKNQSRSHISKYFNIKYDALKYNKQIEVLYHFHDYFKAGFHNKNNVDNILEIGNYESIKKFFNDNTNIYTLNHCATNNFLIKLFNQKPINKVLLSGSASKLYRHRQLFLLLIQNNKDKIDLYRHPGYINKKYTEDIYPYKLNSYLCCFTSCTIFDIIICDPKNKIDYEHVIFAKVYEIMAVGSLLLVDDSYKDGLINMGIKDGINCIFCNVDNYLDKVNYIVDVANRDEIDKIRMNGYNFIREYHTESHRVNELNTILDSICSKFT